MIRMVDHMASKWLMCIGLEPKLVHSPQAKGNAQSRAVVGVGVSNFHEENL
jgi:hypothetical protein